MSLNVPNTINRLKQKKIFNIFSVLYNMPKTSVVKLNDVDEFEIQHDQQFVPDFKFVWCSVKEHYRVYIMVGDTKYKKKVAGYTICTIGTTLAATGFCVMYQFIHKHRANNREVTV